MVDLAWEEADAKKIASGLNTQVRLKKQANQAMVWNDIDKLKKLVKQLAKQLQV